MSVDNKISPRRQRTATIRTPRHFVGNAELIRPHIKSKPDAKSVQSDSTQRVEARRASSDSKLPVKIITSVALIKRRRDSKLILERPQVNEQQPVDVVVETKLDSKQSLKSLIIADTNKHTDIAPNDVESHKTFELTEPKVDLHPKEIIRPKPPTRTSKERVSKQPVPVDVTGQIKPTVDFTKQPDAKLLSEELSPSVDMTAVSYDETINAFVAKIRSLKKDNDSLRDDNMSYREEIKSLREETKVIKQNYETIQDKVFKYKDQFLRAREECVETINDLNQTNNEKLQLQQELKSSNDANKTTQNEQQSKIDELSGKLAKYKSNKLSESEFIELRDRNIVLTSEVDKLMATINERNVTINEAEQKHQESITKSDEVDALTKQLREHVSEIEELKSYNKDSKTKLEELQERIVEINKEGETKEEELLDMNRKLQDKLDKLNKDIRDKDKEVTAKLFELADENEKLTSGNSILERLNRENVRLLEKNRVQTDDEKLQVTQEYESRMENMNEIEQKDKSEIKNLEKRNLKLKSQTEKLQQTLSERDKEIKRLHADIATGDATNIQSLKTLEAKNVLLKKDLDKMKKTQSEKDGKIGELTRIIEQHTNPDDLIQQLEEAIRKISRLQNELKKKDAELLSFKEKIQLLSIDQNNSQKVTENHREKLEQDKRILEDTNSSQSKALKRLVSENDMLTLNIQHLNEKQVTLHTQMEELMTTNEDLVQTLQRERFNHRETEKHLRAERVANTELAEDFHNQRLVEVTANQTIVRQQYQQQQKQQHQNELQHPDKQLRQQAQQLQKHQLPHNQQQHKQEIHSQQRSVQQGQPEQQENAIAHEANQQQTKLLAQRYIENSPDLGPTPSATNNSLKQGGYSQPSTQGSQPTQRISQRQRQTKVPPNTQSATAVAQNNARDNTIKPHARIERNKNENKYNRSYTTQIKTTQIDQRDTMRRAKPDKQIPGTRSQPDGEPSKVPPPDEIDEESAGGLPLISQHDMPNDTSYSSRNRHLQKLKTQKKW